MAFRRWLQLKCKRSLHPTPRGSRAPMTALWREVEKFFRRADFFLAFYGNLLLYFRPEGVGVIVRRIFKRFDERCGMA